MKIASQITSLGVVAATAMGCATVETESLEIPLQVRREVLDSMVPEDIGTVRMVTSLPRIADFDDNIRPAIFYRTELSGARQGASREDGIEYSRIKKVDHHPISYTDPFSLADCRLPTLSACGLVPVEKATALTERLTSLTTDVSWDEAAARLKDVTTKGKPPGKRFGKVDPLVGDNGWGFKFKVPFDEFKEIAPGTAFAFGNWLDRWQNHYLKPVISVIPGLLFVVDSTVSSDDAPDGGPKSSESKNREPKQKEEQKPAAPAVDAPTQSASIF